MFYSKVFGSLGSLDRQVEQVWSVRCSAWQELSPRELILYGETIVRAEGRLAASAASEGVLVCVRRVVLPSA